MQRFVLSIRRNVISKTILHRIGVQMARQEGGHSCIKAKKGRKQPGEGGSCKSRIWFLVVCIGPAWNCKVSEHFEVRE